MSKKSAVGINEPDIGMFKNHAFKLKKLVTLKFEPIEYLVT